VTPRRTAPPALVALTACLIWAQSGITAAIALAYLRRNVTWLLFVVMLAVLLGGLASLVRGGTHGAWVTAVACESAYTVFGLVRVMSGPYLGGTLLGMATLGLLLHPAAGRAFTVVPRRLAERADAGLADAGLADQPSGGAS
jgi:hypothetical protein